MLSTCRTKDDVHHWPIHNTSQSKRHEVSFLVKETSLLAFSLVLTQPRVRTTEFCDSITNLGWFNMAFPSFGHLAHPFMLGTKNITPTIHGPVTLVMWDRYSKNSVSTTLYDKVLVGVPLNGYHDYLLVISKWNILAVHDQSTGLATPKMVRMVSLRLFLDTRLSLYPFKTCKSSSFTIFLEFFCILLTWPFSFCLSPATGYWGFHLVCRAVTNYIKKALNNSLMGISLLNNEERL